MQFGAHLSARSRTIGTCFLALVYGGVAAVMLSIAGCGSGGGGGSGLPIDEGLILYGDELQVAAGKSASVTLQVDGAVGDTLSFTVGEARHGHASIDPRGRLHYQHEDTFTGSESVEVQAQDGAGSISRATVVVDIVNGAPDLRWGVDAGVMQARVQGAAVEAHFIATDSEGHSLRFALETPPRSGTATLSHSQVIYEPGDAVLTDILTIRASDGYGGSDTLSLTIEVLDIPGPLVNHQLFEVVAGSSGSFTLAMDAGGEDLSVVLETELAHGDAILSGRDFSYTHNDTYLGIDSGVVRVSNDSGADTATIAVRITNEPPVVTPLAYTFRSEQRGVVVFSGSDADGHDLSYEIVSRPEQGHLAGVVRSGAIYTAPGSPGSVVFTYRAFDGYSYSEPAEVSITVGENRRPIVDGPAESQEVTAGSTVGVAMEGHDPNGDGILWRIVESPTKGTVEVAGNTIFYTHGAREAIGRDSFWVVVSDGLLESSPFQVEVTVVNEEPVVRSIEMEALPGDRLVIAFDGEDADDHPLRYQLVSPPSLGQLGPVQGGTVSYSIAYDQRGPVTFTYSASDSWSTSNVASVTVLVAPHFEMALLADRVGGASDIVASDLDSDGDQDFVIYDRHDGQLLVYEQVEDAAFRVHVLSQGSQSRYRQVAVDDLDRDGFPDIAVMLNDRERSGLFVFQASADLSRWSAREIGDLSPSLLRTHASVAAGDMNGDGSSDLVVAGQDIGTQLFLNDGTGGEWSRVQVAEPGEIKSPTMMELADMNGDDRPDIVVIDAQHSQVRVLTQPRSIDGFWFSRAISGGASVMWALQLADMDGDGDLDVLASELERNNLLFIENRGVAWADPEILVAGLGDEYDGPVQFEVLDVNSDGRLDIVTTVFDDHVRYLENTGENEFSHRIIGHFRRIHSIAVVDRGGGKVRAMVGGWDEAGLRWLSTDDGGDNWQQRWASPPRDFRDSGPLEVGSFGGDEISDFVFGIKDSWRDPPVPLLFDVVEQAGEVGARMDGPISSPDIGESRGLALVDVNGDGRDDVVTGNAIYFSDQWRTDTHTLHGGDRAEDIAPITLGRDSQSGVAVLGQNQEVWIHRAVDGALQLVTKVSTRNCDSIAVVDCNDDGLDDLLVMNSVGLEYHAQPEVVSDPWHSSILAAGVEGQLLVAPLASGSDAQPMLAINNIPMIIIQRQGDGSWQASELHSDMDPFVWADIDGDGDPDLAGISRADEQLVWHENGQEWQRRVGMNLPQVPHAIQALDANGDGQDDILIKARRSGPFGDSDHYIGVLLNRVGSGLQIFGVH